MADFNWDQFEQVPQEPAQPDQPAPQMSTSQAEEQPVATESSAKFNWNDYEDVTENALRPDGEQRPAWANGVSPEFAIPKSPLTIAERFKFKGLADEKGGEKFLQQVFPEGVVKQSDGEYKVRKEGLWFDVDPKGNGISVIEAGKKLMSGNTQGLEDIISEAAKDVADIAPELAFIGGSAATAYATGGTSLLYQMGAQFGTGSALAGYKTYLGKINKIDERAPEEIIPEVGMEGVLNFLSIASVPSRTGVALLKGGAEKVGGKVIAKAADITDKTAGQFMATALEAGAEAVGRMSNGVKETFANVYGTVTGVGQENMLRYLDRPKEISSLMKRAVSDSAGSSGAAKQLLELKQIEAAEKVMKEFQPAMNAYYDDLVNQVSGQFKGNFDLKKPISNVTDILRQTGLVEETAARQVTEQVGTGLLDETGKAVTRSLTRTEGKDGIRFLSAQQLLEKAADPNAPEALKQLVMPFGKNVQALEDAMSPIESAIKLLQGKSSGNVKDLLTYEKQFRQAMSSVQDRLIKTGAPKETVEFLRGLKRTMEATVDSQLDSAAALQGGRNMTYKQMRQTYAQTSDMLRSIEQAARDTSKAPIDRAQQLVKFFARPTKNTAVTKREAIANAATILGKYSPAFKQAETFLADASAAASFLPVVRENSLKYGIGVATAGAAGAVAGSDAGQRLQYGAAAAAGAAAVASPRLSKATLNLVRGMQKTNEFLVTRPADQLQTLLRDEQAFNMVVRTGMSLPQLKDESEQNLLQQATQNLMSTTQQGQGQ